MAFVRTDVEEKTIRNKGDHQEVVASVRETPCHRFFSLGKSRSIYPGIQHMQGEFLKGAALVGVGAELCGADGTGFANVLKRSHEELQRSNKKDITFYIGWNLECWYSEDGKFISSLLNTLKKRHGDTIQPLIVGKDALTAQDFPSAEWHAQRPLFNSALGKGVVKKYIPRIQRIAERYAKAVKEKPIKELGDVREMASSYVLEAISSVLFGIEKLEQKEKAIQTLKEIPAFLSNVTNLIVSKIQDYLPSSLHCRKTALDRKRQQCHAIVEKILADNQEAIESKENSDSIFMQLMKLKGYKFNSKECQKIAMFLYGGGFETTSALLYFSLITAAAQPDLFERIKQDIKNHWPNFDGELTEENLNKMELLSAFFEENLKWFPPFSLGKLVLPEDFVHETTGIVLKKGTMVCYDLSVLLQMKNGVYGPDADKFMLRLNDEGKAIINNQLRLFFGGDSVRKCPGQHSALEEVKILFAEFVKAGVELKLDSRLADIHPYLPLEKVFSLGLADRDKNGDSISKYEFHLTTQESRLCEEKENPNRVMLRI